jgi:hypothetical protein
MPVDLGMSPDVAKMRGRVVSSRAILSALALIALGGLQPGRAQELAGGYALSLQTTCQILMFGATNLKPGGSSNSVGTAVFTPSANNRNAGVVEINETVVGGPLLASVTGTIVSSPLHATVAYSASATTLTINGIRYNAIYSNIRNAVADRVFFNGILGAGTFTNACSSFGVLQAVTD